MSSAEARVEDSEAARMTDGESTSGDHSGKRSSRLAAKVSDKDEASLATVAVRDVALVAALLSLFAAAESWATASGLGFARGLSVVDGLLVGAAIAAICHEWGHFAGARLAGGHSPLKPFGQFFPIFDFDYKNNDARSFDWMSIGGNAGDIGVVLLFFFALPMTSLGVTALVAGAIGFAVFASAIEFPVIQKARGGLTGIEALSTIPRDFVRRYTRWGLAAAAVSLVVL